MISMYSGIAMRGELVLLKRLGEIFKGRKIVHINSTQAGGGVAEILQRMIPFFQSLGIDARWEVIEGDARFFEITKRVHNTLQGSPETVTKEMWDYHYDINKRNAGRIDLDSDAVMVHDPHPLPLIEFKKNGKWIWRCHIDLSKPQANVLKRISRYAKQFDSAVFSVSRFAWPMEIDKFIISPSIDPISEKNRDLTEKELEEVSKRFGLPRDRPIILQVSRFDRFKDPAGVIEAYRAVKKYNDCVLVLAGSPATDDPEGEIVLAEIREAAANDPDILILLLPPFSDKEINALQRLSTVIVQKSLKEGFGLTVSEGMWKGKPVIGGAVGGIPQQIIHGVTGFLIHSVEGTAFRIRQLFNNPDMARSMGEKGREFVRRNFLITRQLKDYLSVWYAAENKGKNIYHL